MKLLRYGSPGSEKPGMLDADGKIRSLDGVIDDLGGDALSDASLEKLRSIDPTTLPEVDASTRALADMCLLIFNTNEFMYVE